MGNQHKKVTVTTNDPVHEAVELNVTGEVDMLLRVSTTFLDFRDVFAGGSKTESVDLIPMKGVEFEILEVETPGPEFEVQVVSEHDIRHSLRRLIESARQRIAQKFSPQAPVPDPHATKRQGRGVRPDVREPGTRTINVRVSPTAPRGRHSGRLRIHTDLEEKPLFDVHVVANVVGNVVVEPDNRHLGSVKQGETKYATYTILTRRGASVKITDVETDAEYISAELLQVVPGSEYEIKLSVLPTAPVGMLRGTATVRTTDKEQPNVELRYNVRVTTR